MTDLDQLRAWRSAAPGRALSISDPEAKHGAALLKFEGGKRWRAEYESAQTAALALSAGRVRWREVAGPETQFMGRPVARRGRPRKKRQ